MLKKGLCLLCALALVLCGLQGASAATMTTTVLVYMCGADLETEDRAASTDIREMISGGISASGPVHVLIETGGAERWHLRAIDSSVSMRFEVTGDGISEVWRDSTSRNMGAASTLRDFIAYGIANYPADRYILVLWDHGGGPLDGVCFDELHDDDGLTMAELAQALRGGLGSNRLDAVLFDACLMGTWEVAYTLQPYVDYMGASEDSVPGDGLNYKSWLGILASDPSISTINLLEKVSDSMVETIEASDPSDHVTFSIVKLQALDQLTAALSSLGSAASELMETSPNALTTVRESILSFGEFEEDEEEAYATDLVDIRLTVDLLESLLPTEVAAVRSALDNVVLFNDVSSTMTSYAYGLAMFWPAYTVDDYPEYLTDYPSVSPSREWTSFAVAYGTDYAAGDSFHLYGGTHSTFSSVWNSCMYGDDDDDYGYDYDDDWDYDSGCSYSLSDIWNSYWYSDDDDCDYGYDYDDDDDYSMIDLWNSCTGGTCTTGPATATGAGEYPGLWSDQPGYTGTYGITDRSEIGYPGLWSDLDGYTGSSLGGDSVTISVSPSTSPSTSTSTGSGTYDGLWGDIR